MKNLKKILSAVIASTMLVSCFAINSFAAQSRTMTVAADKTADLVAGDVVTVTVTLDHTLEVAACGYQLNFDTEAFTIDTATAGFGKPKNYIDSAWLTGLKNGELPWVMMMGNPSINENKANGYIKASWTPTDMLVSYPNGMPAEAAENNLVIGKFKFTVLDTAVAGESYNFSLESSVSATAGGGTNNNDVMTLVDATVSIKASDEKPAADTTTATLASNPNAALDNKYTQGFLATATATEDTKPITGIKFEFENGSGAIAERSYALSAISGVESVSNGTVKVAVNIVNVLDGHTVDCVASAY